MCSIAMVTLATTTLINTSYESETHHSQNHTLHQPSQNIVLDITQSHKNIQPSQAKNYPSVIFPNNNWHQVFNTTY